MSQQNYNRKTGIISSLIVSLVLIALTIVFVVNRQFIIDQITVWQYHSTSEIDGLINRTGMNDNGKFLFYASQPKLDATQNFNNECDRIENDTSILGCYSGSRIYIYDVTDNQLNGIREVTTAHETLHAVYARMGVDEKTEVDKLIEAEYDKLKTDKDYSDLMAFYARTEPGQRDNELHSIIGTEVANISPKLEAHYNKYFSNRQEVVNLNAQYSSVFKGLKSQADALSVKLSALAASIKADTAGYNQAAQALSSDISAFNVRAANGNFSSQSQFNNERLLLTQRTANLDATRNSINNDISNYESMLSEYNTLASESKKLYNVIDSTLAPAPSV